LTTSDETSDSRWVQKDRVLEFLTLSFITIRYEGYLNFNGSVNCIEYTTPTPSECHVKVQRHV